MKDKHFDDAKRYASQIIEIDQYATVFTQMAAESAERQGSRLAQLNY